jgi:hypothetical protein
MPVSIETVGALGNEAPAFLRDLGQRIAVVTGEPRSIKFTMQRISIIVQHGNASCIVGTVPLSVTLDDLAVCHYIRPITSRLDIILK